MEKRDLNSLKQAWDKISHDNPELEALSIIPMGVRKDMINCFIKVLASTGSTQQNVFGQYGLFVKFLTLIRDFYQICEKIDPLEFAKSEYERIYGAEFPEWFVSPIIDTSGWDLHDAETHEWYLIFEKSEYFNQFLQAINASASEGRVISQFITAWGERKLLEIPSRVPDCFIGSGVGRLFIIYFNAAKAEWLQIQSIEHNSQDFDSITNLTLRFLNVIENKHPDIIAEWEWYWNDKHQDIFSIASKMLMQKYLGIDPMDNEHHAESNEFFLTGILYWDIILKNWPEYIFSYLLPETLQDVYMQMKFARFLNLHPDGNAFITMYSKYCSEKGTKPLIYVKSQLEIDSKGQDKLWISPTIKNFDKNTPRERYRIICRLFDILEEWGAFGEDIDIYSLKTLFAYRFSGVMPIRNIQEKLPWAKSKTELAILICILTENWDGRRPYKLVNSFFDMDLSNITELAKRADDRSVRNLILRAFE